MHITFDLRDQDGLRLAFFRRARWRPSERLRSCQENERAKAPPPPVTFRALFFWPSHVLRAPGSSRSFCCPRQRSHTDGAEISLQRPSCLAAFPERRSARCVRPTSATSRVIRAPAPRWFPSRGAPASRQVTRFGGPRASVRSSLWHRCRSSRVAKSRSREPRSPHSCARVNRCARVCRPECLPSIQDLRPAAPSRAPGSGLAKVSRPCPPQPFASDVFRPCELLGSHTAAEVPSPRSVAGGAWLF